MLYNSQSIRHRTHYAAPAEKLSRLRQQKRWRYRDQIAQPMSRHIIWYSLIGALFGIADWYFPRLLQWLNPPAWLFALSIWAIWVLLAFPVAIHATRATGDARRAALAASVCWTWAILAYYGYYVWLLAIPGLPQLDDARFAIPLPARWWPTWGMLLRATLIPQIGTWLPSAIVGGAIGGWLIGHSCLQLMPRLYQATAREAT